VIDRSQDWPKLLSLVSHELRTPAGVVEGYLKMLQQGRCGPLADAQRPVIEAAERSSARVLELLTGISDLAALDANGAHPRQRTTLAAFLRTIPVAAHADAGVLVEVGEAPDVELEVDLTRVRRAFVSLSVAVRRTGEPSEPVRVRAWEGAGHDELDVWIALGVGDAIAEAGPHVRGARLAYDCWRAGHGLDLVLAARVIELHDGEVCSLATRPGSSVTLVRLPTSASQAA
jgi:signal transduction histidine kinase